MDNQKDENVLTVDDLLRNLSDVLACMSGKDIARIYNQIGIDDPVEYLGDSLFRVIEDDQESQRQDEKRGLYPEFEDPAN